MKVAAILRGLGRKKIKTRQTVKAPVIQAEELKETNIINAEPIKMNHLITISKVFFLVSDEGIMTERKVYGNISVA